MDGTRFDTLAKWWATPGSRRWLLGGVYGAALLGLLGRFGAGARRQEWTAIADAADAECAAKADPEYETVCRYLACGKSGRCVQSTAGAWRCVGWHPDCPDHDHCEQDRDCKTDRVCARLGGCCDNDPFQRVCLARYGEPGTTPAPPTPTRTADEKATGQAAADASCAVNPDPESDYGDRCRYRQCPIGGGYCVINAEDTWSCVEPFGIVGLPPHTCTDDGCKRDGDCGPGMVCVRLGRCMDNPDCKGCMRKYYYITRVTPFTRGPGTPVPPSLVDPASPTAEIAWSDSGIVVAGGLD